MKPFLLVIGAAALLAWAQPSVACSVSDDYRVPTNLELVREADVILIGRVVYAPPTSRREEEPDEEPLMIVRPIEVLKGGPLPREIRFPGWAAIPRTRIRSDPNELYQPHKEALMGGCSRETFLRNSRVLFFLKKEGGRLVPHDPPFSRWAEDIPSADSPWAQAVRLYVEVAALPQAEQRTTLLARREALAGQTKNRAAPLLVQDIDRQLRGPSPTYNSGIDRDDPLDLGLDWKPTEPPR